MPDQMTVEEAANRLLSAFLVQFEDRDDDEDVPVRAMFEALGEACNVSNVNVSDIPEWETMGWLRSRIRSALGDLAAGERIP